MSKSVEHAVAMASSYFSCNQVGRDQIVEVVRKMHDAVLAISGDRALEPPVPIEESYTDDYIICLEDGEKVTLLKRYLKNHFDMTPEEYIEKWNLPAGYPFVTKNYSATRSGIAKRSGLGKPQS